MKERSFLYQNFTLPNFLENLVWHYKNPIAGMGVNGLIVFCGTQGSGKTLSAVLYLKKVMDLYPECLVCSNIALNSDVFDPERVIPYEGLKSLTDLSNGEDGIVYFLDEIQLEFNSLESKQMNMPIFEFICQQRKARKMVIATTQVFGRLAKPFREQFKMAVSCKMFFNGYFCVQRAYVAENVAYEDDIKTELTPSASACYFVHPDFYGYYDTYQMVDRIRGDFFADR